jgi:putative resolvase
VKRLRRWEAEGRLVAEHTPGGHRHYGLAKRRPEMFHADDKASRKTVAYARVASHDRKDDLAWQKQVLEVYCTAQGWTFEIVAALAAGMNYHKKGLKQLLNDILAEHVGKS